MTLCQNGSPVNTEISMNRLNIILGTLDDAQSVRILLSISECLPLAGIHSVTRGLDNSEPWRGLPKNSHGCKPVDRGTPTIMNYRPRRGHPKTCLLACLRRPLQGRGWELRPFFRGFSPTATVGLPLRGTEYLSVRNGGLALDGKNLLTKFPIPCNKVF
jgi:hypothetical protein